jgi:glycine/D-amino acid oxidase-like deaminating enzyme
MSASTPGRGPRVAVVGGGVLGASTARHLALAGARTLLVTEGALSSSASGRSLSWLNSAGRRSEAYHRLRTVGIDRYRTLASRHPDLDWLRFAGGLRWSAPESVDDQRADHAHEQALGYDSVWLTPDDVRRRFPAVDADQVPPTGAIWNPGEGWVDLPSLVELCVKELLDSGGDVVTEAGPTRLVTAGGRVRAVRTASGDEWPVDAAVLATGAGVPAAAAELGVHIPEATPLALLVRTAPVRTGLRVVLNTPRVALRPALEGTLSVDADWVTPSITATDDGGWTAPQEVVAELLAEASAVLEGHPRLLPAQIGIGPKPIPADGEPVVGALPGVEGGYAVFTHSGATLGLILGELLAGQVLTGKQPALLAPFTPARFAG